MALSSGGALADEDYVTNYQVSRNINAVKVKYVYQISAPGSHTPKQDLKLSEEGSIKNLDYITPLGIRQQYMIGDELRYRYADEQIGEFLDDKYNITQLFLQTAWNDTQILSAQAMSLGIYPPGKNNYVLEES